MSAVSVAPATAAVAPKEEPIATPGATGSGVQGQSVTAPTQPGPKGSRAGFFLVFIPIVLTFIAVANDEFPIPLVFVLAPIVSAFVVFAEARRLGMTSARGGASPIMWSIGAVGLYGIAVPWFLRKRRQLLNAQTGAAFPAVLSIFVMFMTAAGLGASRQAHAIARAAPAGPLWAAQGRVTAAERPEAPREQATVQPLKVLLREYQDNEVRADAAFKGRRIRVTGRVGDVKKDILDSIYVTVGTGAVFEIPVVQCMLDNGAAGVAAQYSKGSQITVEGNVSGLMMNVLMHDCVIVQ